MTNAEILQMIESGDVSVKDAVGMMSSTEKPTPEPKGTDERRWFRVRVSNLETGKNKVSVNIPLGFMKLGFSLGSRFAPELEDFDLDEIMSDLDQYAEGSIIEVEDEDANQRVEISIR